MAKASKTRAANTASATTAQKPAAAPATVEGAEGEAAGLPGDPFAKASPTVLTESDVEAMDFAAIVEMGLESIDAMDTELTKSGTLADARTAFITARDLVAGFQSGKLA
jgi:hypothetical protein